MRALIHPVTRTMLLVIHGRDGHCSVGGSRLLTADTLCMLLTPSSRRH